MDRAEAIMANAEMVIRTFSQNNGVVLDYDEKSVEWLDGYIESNRANWDAVMREKLSSVLGSFLGECVRRNFGGEWRMTEHGLGLAFAGNNVAFPFNKIRKQFENGSEDSIAAFYRTIPSIF